MAKAGSNKPKNPSRRNFGIQPDYGKINQRNRKGLPLPDMKNFLFTLVTVAGFSLGAVAQDTIHNEHTASPQILTYAEQMPEPTINVPKFLAKNLHYGDISRWRRQCSCRYNSRADVLVEDFVLHTLHARLCLTHCLERKRRAHFGFGSQ